MSDKLREEGRRFAQFLSSLPEKTRIEGNKIVLAEAESEHKDFHDNFQCGLAISVICRLHYSMKGTLVCIGF